MPQAAIILNTRSGEGSAGGHELSQRLVRRLRDRGIEGRVIDFGVDRGRALGWRRRLDDLLDAGAGSAIALGGDGTVLAVAQALLGRDAALGIVPLGTANLLARDLAIPLDPTHAVADVVEALAAGEVRRIDVGRVNGELFLCASMLGLATTLARVREAARGQGALQRWPWIARRAWWLLRRYPYRLVRLDLGGRSLTLRSRAIVVSNNPILPKAGVYPGRARLDDALLGVYGVCEGSAWELPRVALRLVNGTWPDEPRIFHHDTPRLTVREARGRGQGRRIRVLNDGERLRLELPLHYEVLPRALPVLVRPRP